MFKAKILTRFLMRRFFSGVGTVMLVISGIIFAITFVERLPSNPSAISALIESWVRLIEYIPLFLPLAIFMGTLLSYYSLTRSSESVIVSSAGLSPYQSARPFFLGAIMIGIITTAFLNPYSVYLGERNRTSNHLKLIDDAVWLRESSKTGFITLRANNMDFQGDDLHFYQVTIYTQDENFKLKNRIEAKEVKLSQDGLFAEKATVWDKFGIKKIKTWNTKTILTPRAVMDRYLQPNQISFWKLPSFIKKMNNIGVPIFGHLVQFWTLLFLPLTLIALVTLGVAFSQTKQRRNHNFVIKFALGIIACFALYFLLNVFSALGTTGALFPLLSVVAPPIIIIAIAGVFIATYDTT